MEKKISLLKERYVLAKEAKTGSNIVCPSCGNIHKKTTYQKVFCNSTICKDHYWNNVDNRKRNRKHPKHYYDKYNVGEKSYESRFGERSIYADMHPFEGLNDDEYKNF